MKLWVSIIAINVVFILADVKVSLALHPYPSGPKVIWNNCKGVLETPIRTYRGEIHNNLMEGQLISRLRVSFLLCWGYESSRGNF